MATLVLRLAGPLQSWAGYRVSYTRTGTSPVPTKSGVAGLLGACLGVSDYGSLIDAFRLYVRVDRTNPVATDLQVASAPKPGERSSFGRTLALSQAKVQQVPTQLTGTNLSSLSNRDFVPHAEFMCGLETDATTVASWHEQSRRPVFMPYLGRQANAPTFPALLGWSISPATSVLAELPHVPRELAKEGEEPQALRLYRIDGDYYRTGPETRLDPAFVSPPRRDTEGAIGMGDLISDPLIQHESSTAPTVGTVHWTRFPARALPQTNWTDHVQAHRAVMRLFPQQLDGPAAARRASNGILFRLDVVADEPIVLVQSTTPPELLPAGARTMVVGQTAWDTEKGETILFRVGVNPIRRNGRSKREILVAAGESHEWLGERLAGVLGQIEIVNHVRDFYRVQGVSRGAAPILAIDVFDGLAVVDDVPSFDALRRHGVGRAKAYGAGLLTARRLA